MADANSMRVVVAGGGTAPAQRYQHCTFCKNHGVVMRKNGHACQHKDCKCLLCRLTRIAQIAMRHQQALWRHQGRQMAKNRNFQMLGFSSRQLCDKCRNHKEYFKKRGHKSKCLYESCKCPLCNLTDKRRLVMKHQQRVRRANVTAHAESSSDEDGTDGNNPAGEGRDDDEDVDLPEGHEGNAYHEGSDAYHEGSDAYHEGSDAYHEGSDSYAIESAINAVTQAIKQLPLNNECHGYSVQWRSKL